MVFLANLVSFFGLLKGNEAELVLLTSEFSRLDLGSRSRLRSHHEGCHLVVDWC